MIPYLVHLVMVLMVLEGMVETGETVLIAEMVETEEKEEMVPVEMAAAAVL